MRVPFGEILDEYASRTTTRGLKTGKAFPQHAETVHRTVKREVIDQAGAACSSREQRQEGRLPRTHAAVRTGRVAGASDRSRPAPSRSQPVHGLQVGFSLARTSLRSQALPARPSSRVQTVGSPLSPRRECTVPPRRERPLRSLCTPAAGRPDRIEHGAVVSLDVASDLISQRLVNAQTRRRHR